MPRKGKSNVEKQFHAMVSSGATVAQAIKAISQGRNIEQNAIRGIRGIGGGVRAGARLLGMVKRRKGGVIMKGNRAVFIDDGKYPNRKQYTQMYKNARGRKPGYAKSVGHVSTTQSRMGSRSVASQQMLPYKNRPSGKSNSLNNSSITLNHQESIASIVSNGGGTANPQVFTYDLNAGLRNLCQWGGQVAYNWQYYRVIDMVFTLQSTCASTTTGRWAMGCDYDPMYPTVEVEDINTIVQLNGKSGDVKDHLLFHLSNNLINASGSRKRWLVRSGEVPENGDPKEYDLGHLYIGVESADTVVIGNLYIEYTFELINVRPTVSPSSSSAYTSTCSYNNPLRALTEYNFNSPVTYTQDPANGNVWSVIHFNSKYVGMINIILTGTSLNVNNGFFYTLSVDSALGTVYSLLGAITSSTLTSEMWSVDVIAGSDVYLTPFNSTSTVSALRIWILPSGSELNDNNGMGIHAPTKQTIRAVSRPIMPLPISHLSSIREDTSSIDMKLDDEYVDERPMAMGYHVRQNRPGEGNMMQKGGNCDEHAILVYLLFLLQVCISQILPPTIKRPTFTTQPTTAIPTSEPTPRPTDSPTTLSPTYVYYRSSIIETSGSAASPLGTITDKVTAFKMFTKINGTSFRLDHNGIVLVTGVWGGLGPIGGTAGEPAYTIHGAPGDHTYDNYVVMTDCERYSQVFFQLLNNTFSQTEYTLVKDSATTGTVVTKMTFTPVNGYKIFGPAEDLSTCAPGCVIAERAGIIT